MPSAIPIVGLLVLSTALAACHRSPSTVRWDHDYLIADRHFAYKNDPDLAKRKRMLDVALRRYRQLLTQAPDDERRAGVRFAIGETLKRLGQHQRAIRWYWRIVNGDEARYRRSKALYRIAKIHLDQLGARQTGHTLLERVILNYPKTLYASHALKRRIAELMRSKVGLARGMDYLGRLHRQLARTPLEDDCVYYAGKWAQHDGMPRLAETMYERLLKAHPKSPFYDDAYWRLQTLQRRRGAYRLAIRTLLSFWRTRRSAWFFGTYETRLHPEAIYEVAQIYRLNLGEYRRAMHYYELLRETYPTDKLRDDCLYYIGWSQLKLGQRQDAVATFRQLQLEGTEFIRVSSKDPRTGLPKVYRWQSPYIRKARALMQKAGLGPL